MPSRVPALRARRPQPSREIETGCTHGQANVCQKTTRCTFGIDDRTKTPNALAPYVGSSRKTMLGATVRAPSPSGSDNRSPSPSRPRPRFELMIADHELHAAAPQQSGCLPREPQRAPAIRYNARCDTNRHHPSRPTSNPTPKAMPAAVPRCRGARRSHPVAHRAFLQLQRREQMTGDRTGIRATAGNPARLGSAEMMGGAPSPQPTVHGRVSRLDARTTRSAVA